MAFYRILVRFVLGIDRQAPAPANDNRRYEYQPASDSIWS